MVEGDVISSTVLTQNWTALGENTDANYRQIDIYQMEWQSQLPVHLQDFIVAAAPFGGPIALIRKDRNAGPTELIHVFSAAGLPIKTIKWEGKVISSMSWSCSEELVVVNSQGSVFVYPLDPHLTRGRIACTFGKEVKDGGVIDSRIFNSLHSETTGVAVLTKSFRFSLVKSLQDPRTNELQDVGLDSPPSCWQVVSKKDGIRILVAKDALIYILGVNDRSCKEVTVRFDSQITAITEMCLSFSQSQLALFSDTGAVWLGTSDLSMKKSEHTIKHKSRPQQMIWCGAEAVLGVWGQKLVLVGFEKNDVDLHFMDYIHVVAELDGCRVISSKNHYVLQKVPAEVNEICKLGSFASARVLLDSSEFYRTQNNKTDEFLKNLKDRDAGDSVDAAVDQCIRAAGHQWDELTQKAFLRAASFGKVFQDEQKTPDDYVRMCKNIRVLNAIRKPEIGMPLSLKQFECLGERVVIDRLILRQHWPIAQSIAKYLKLDKEIENKILVHWACYKVEQKHLKSDEVAEAIGERLSSVPAIEYSDIANRATDEGRKDLAVLLLNFEPRAAKQIPLLLKLEKPEEALSKAVDSSDDELVYQAIFHMKHHDSSNFNLTLRKSSVALNLYLKLCRETDREMLENIFDQEDNHDSIAKLKLEEALASSQREHKIACLQTAAERFRRAPDPFSAKQTELYVKLLRIQMKYEQKVSHLKLFDLTVNDTVTELLQIGELRTAEEIKKDFGIPDKRWVWLRAQVFARKKQWEELEKLSKQKRVPLIGFEGFAELCLRMNDKREALKYILKLKEEPKVTYILRYTENDIVKAARLALEQKDMECLQLLREKAIERPITAPLAGQVDECIAQLRNRR